MKSFFNFSAEFIDTHRVDHDGNLIIYSTGPFDEGQYRCSAANEHGQVNLEVQLTVSLTSPKLKFNR